MKQELRDVVARFLMLSQVESDEDDMLLQLYAPNGMPTTAELANISANEPIRAGRALLAFLEALPESVLYSILVLMYAGRDEVDVLGYVDYLCSAFSTAEEAIIAICEKAPRNDYVRRGIESLGNDRLETLHAAVTERLRGR